MSMPTKVLIVFAAWTAVSFLVAPFIGRIFGLNDRSSKGDDE